MAEKTFYATISPKEAYQPKDVDEAPDVEINFYYSDVDGTLVVEIETERYLEDDEGPLLRVWLNDGCIYENPPFPGR